MQRCVTTSRNYYKLAFAASVGGVLELYDFLIYALMACYIAEHFFPANAVFPPLLNVFATVAVGYFARPFGGVFFGHFCDRYGRRAAFTLSIGLMAVSTGLIGCLPGYDVFGVFAPICLVILRLGQGFAMGGEIPAAITYLSENSAERQGLTVSIFFLALMLGITFGTGILTILISSLTQEQMFVWGWRVPFLLSGLLAGISYWVRCYFNKSGFFLPLANARRSCSVPISELFRNHMSSVVCGALIMSLGAATVMTYGVYSHSYLSSLLGFSRYEVAWHSMVAFLVFAPLPLLSGLLCDLVNRKILIAALALIVLFLSWPTFQYFVSEDAQLRKILMICALYTGFTAGLLPPVLANFFPREVRYTGVALTYNAGYTFIGGAIPFLSTWLTQHVGFAAGPAICMMVSAVLCLAALFFPFPDFMNRGAGKPTNAQDSS